MATSVDLDFLEEMDARAKDLAKDTRREANRLIKKGVHLPGKRKSKDYWAKPFYSDVSTFRRGVPRVFIGINSKGNRYSLKYDKRQRNGQRLWSGNKPLHNAYLDECWGDRAGGTEPKGQSSLQIATQRVFEAMYGKGWKRRLRNTPCFNLMPVSSEGTEDPTLDKTWGCGAEWGVELVEYLEPKLLILYGNKRSLTKGKRRSVWLELERKLSLTDSLAPVVVTRTFKIYNGMIEKGPLKGVPVVGLPHLSMIKGRNLRTLCDKLSELAGSHTFL